jgi:hypothetical protein
MAASHWQLVFGDSGLQSTMVQVLMSLCRRAGIAVRRDKEFY